MSEKQKPKIYVGTASWADPGFIEDWYPPTLPATARLGWYAEHFPLVELNSSFYAIPQQRLVQRWTEQTPEGFKFDVKLHKFLSRHSAKLDSLPADLRPKASTTRDKVDLTPALERAMASRFLQEIEPLVAADKMGALLLQLSPGFRPRTNQLSELDDLLGILAEKKHQVAVELRNRDWLTEEHQAGTADFFRKRGVSFVSVDAPKSEHFTAMPAIDLVTNPRLGYMRLHGRNEKGYITGRTVAERFNYQYPDKELDEIADRAEDVADQVSELHVVYNNNASDYAPKAAARFREIMTKRRPGTVAVPGPTKNAPAGQERELALEGRRRRAGA